MRTANLSTTRAKSPFPSPNPGRFPSEIRYCTTIIIIQQTKYNQLFSQKPFILLNMSCLQKFLTKLNFFRTNKKAHRTRCAFSNLLSSLPTCSVDLIDKAVLTFLPAEEFCLLQSEDMRDNQLQGNNCQLTRFPTKRVRQCCLLQSYPQLFQICQRVL